MNQGLIPRRYAKALLMFASEHGTADALYDAMQRLSASFAAEPSLQRALANPSVGAERKQSLLLTAADVESLSPEAASDVKKFMALLEQNRRLDLARDCALAYVELYRKQNHIYCVGITSAAPLQPAELDRIKKLVIDKLPQGAVAQFTTAVNPDLIGGFAISIDNELLDATVANELKQLSLKLLSK